MPNLRGASPVGRDDGGCSYVARAGGKGRVESAMSTTRERVGVTHS